MVDLANEEQLLTLEIDTIYGLVPGLEGTVRQLVDPDVAVAFGWSPNGQALAVAERFLELASGMDLSDDNGFAPETVPPVVATMRKRIEQMIPHTTVTVSGGPSFTFPAHVADQVVVSLPIIVPDAAGQARASRLTRPDNWQPEEWRQLVTGELGSWAIAVDGNHPVAICHTPASTPDSAEAGVWTRTDHRGAGLAPAVVRAWWNRERRQRRVIFYSTNRDNRASLAVARKLDLRPLGWLWAIR